MIIKPVEYDAYLCMGNDNLVCPYCGCENYPDDTYDAPDGEAMITECVECEKSFSAVPTYSVTYTTEPIEQFFLGEKSKIERRLEVYKDGQTDWRRNIYVNTLQKLRDLEKVAEQMLEGNK